MKFGSFLEKKKTYLTLKINRSITVIHHTKKVKILVKVWDNCNIMHFRYRNYKWM